MAPPQRTVKGAAKKADAGGESDEEEAGGAGGGGEEGGDAAAAGSSGGKRRKDKGDAGKASKKAKVDASGAGAGDDEAEAGPSSASGGEGGAAAAAGGEVVERVLGVSKKDPALRVRELLSAGGAKGSLATALTALCAERAGPLLRHRYGNDVIAEVSRGGDGGVLTQICPDGVAAVHEAILAEAERSKDDVSTAGAAMGEDGAAGPAGPPMEHVLVDYFSSRALRRLVLASDEDGEGSAAASFSAAFWLRVLDGRCKSWVGSHADKVLAAFLHCGAPAARAAAAKQLQPLVKESLVEWSQRFVGPANGHHGLHPRPEPGAGSGAVAPSTAAGAKRGRAAGATGSKGGKAAAAAEAEHFEFEDTAAGAGEAIAKGPAASGKQAGGKAGNPPPAVVAKKAKPELPPAAAAASAERQADGAAAASGGRRPSGRAAAAGVKTIQEAAVAAPVAAAAAAAAADSLPRSPIKTRSSRQGATAKK